MSDGLDKRVTGGFLGLGGDPPYLSGGIAALSGKRLKPPTVLEELRQRRVAAGAKLTRLAEAIEAAQAEFDQCGIAIDALMTPPTFTMTEAEIAAAEARVMQPAANAAARDSLTDTLSDLSELSQRAVDALPGSGPLAERVFEDRPAGSDSGSCSDCSVLYNMHGMCDCDLPDDLLAEFMKREGAVKHDGVLLERHIYSSELVEALRRDGKSQTSLMCTLIGWTHETEPHGLDIIAYRILSQSPATKEADKSEGAFTFGTTAHSSPAKEPADA